LEGLVLKRSFDFTVAGLLLVLTLPLVAIAALMIQLETGDSAIFCQYRMGRGFRTFKLWKLRTMRAGCAGSAFTLGADPRITCVGRWLRRTKVDELPQLWNVVRGDMSLVGPRPVLPELTHEFRPLYERLLAARPGLTDPATVKYCREVEILALVPDPLDYFKRVIVPDKLNISDAYLQRATVQSDLVVLMQTVIALVPSWAPAAVRKPAMEQVLVAGSAESMAGAATNGSQ